MSTPKPNTSPNHSQEQTNRIQKLETALNEIAATGGDWEANYPMGQWGRCILIAREALETP